MTISKIISVEGIGEVQFAPSHRAKRISISIRPFKKIRVAFPKNASLHKAMAVVVSKRAWIQRSQISMAKLEDELSLAASNAPRIDVEQASRFLADRITEMAKRHGLSFNRLSVRSQKTRWGSCSQENNISLNKRLIVLPERLVDYVLLHELAHTRIKNHSREFWTYLLGMMPDALERKNELNRHPLVGD